MAEVLFDRKKIQSLVSKIAKRINKDHRKHDKPIVLLGVLGGAAPFMCDLAKRITVPVEMQFLKCHSYEGTKQRSLSFDYWPEYDFSGKDVIIVEDIVDTGSTMREVQQRLLRDNEPRSISICSLLKRKGCSCYIEYMGCQVNEGLWLYGYGMDWPDGLNRNLSNIYIKS